MILQEVHHYHNGSQAGQYCAGGPVQRFGGGLVGKQGGQAGAQECEQNTQNQAGMSGMPPMVKWDSAPVKAVKVMIKTLVPTAVFSS